MSNLLTFPNTTATQIPDAPSRARALDITQSFIVEAPAGSGKTGLLIQRFLKLLATVEDPTHILAITFTRKATAELADRVLAQLAAAAANTPPTEAFDKETRPLAQAVLARDAQPNWNLLDNPSRLRIKTIDAVCADIAASLPILSGSGGGLSPSENSADLYAEAARRTLAQLGGPDPKLNHALETILLHRDANLANCQSLLADMLALRDQWGELIPLASPTLDDHFLDTEVLPRLEKALDLAICRGLTRLNQSLPENVLNALCTLAAEMGHLEGYDGNPSPLTICAGKYTPPEEKAIHLDHWLALINLLLTKEGEFRKERGLNIKTVSFMIEKHHRQQLAQLIDQVRHDNTLRDLLCSVRTLPPAQYPPEQWHVTKALFHALARALAELQLVFAERNRCDFAEIALLAKTALRADSAIEDLNAAGTNLQHLLVDEMQDTSTTQYELIQLLTQRWDGHSQTVFLVGDPKQSIYLFRQARVERFVHTMLTARLGTHQDALPLTPLHLTANFRSQAALVDSFNEAFSKIFPTHPNPQQPEIVPYRQAIPVRPATPSAPAITWHIPPPNPQPEPTDPAQPTLDAQHIREIITSFQARPLPPNRTAPWKIAVLVQARSHLLPIIQAFKQPTPIPYRAIKIEPLADRQEILDLLALTRALLHPADRTAWLALLRTPWCGLTLHDLHLLAGGDQHLHAQTTILDLLNTHGADLSPDAIARLKPFWHILTEALANRAHQPLSQLIHRTWQSFGAPDFTSEEALFNIEQYLLLIDQLETSTGILDITALESSLKKLYAAASTQPHAVDLMTIHNAKGLEWDLVLVPSLEKRGRPNSTKLLNWIEIDPSNELTGDSIARGILAPIAAKGGPASQLYQWMRSIESTRESAERQRLFYVACTRAREELHLFAAPKRRQSGEPIRPSATLLDAAWPAAEKHFNTPTTPNLIQLPTPQPTFAIAAAGTPPQIQRIPLQSLTEKSVIPSEVQGSATEKSVILSEVEGPASAFQPFHRPEGSFTARTLGNTLHTLLELLATRIATGATPTNLLAELPTWQPRIATLLRSAGLSPATIPAHTTDILRGLTRTLASPEGQWLLHPHPQAASESALTTWQPEVDPTSFRSTNLRLDRTFLAGPTPLSHGNTHLWIIDYKTATHSQSDLEPWLTRQKEIYRDQLETYAGTFPHEGRPIRLALFYPMIPHLIHWSP